MKIGDVAMFTENLQVSEIYTIWLSINNVLLTILILLSYKVMYKPI